MSMCHALHPQSDVDILYLLRKIGGCGLLQIHQVVEEKKRNLNDYISRRREKLHKVVKMKNILKITETKAQYKKQQFEN